MAKTCTGAGCCGCACLLIAHQPSVSIQQQQSPSKGVVLLYKRWAARPAADNLQGLCLSKASSVSNRRQTPCRGVAVGRCCCRQLLRCPHALQHGLPTQHHHTFVWQPDSRSSSSWVLHAGHQRSLLSSSLSLFFPRMKLHHAWWSRKDAAVKVTIVTGLNPSRVNQLESQCNSYKGPISAAVYVVLHNPDANAQLTAEHKQQLAEAKDILDKFHKR